MQCVIGVLITFLLTGCSDENLEIWHTEKLDAEFTQAKADEIHSFADYLQMEDRLFKQLDDKIYAQSATGPEYTIDRYNNGSAADPRNQQPNWNRSFELTSKNPRGAVLLLHGMSDSPYSLRTLGKALNQQNYWVIGLRIPGHGTIPSGLRFINRQDMTAAVKLSMRHLASVSQGKTVHIIGYSTGASLALEFALDAQEGKTAPVPASLILISPAIGIHPIAAVAGFKDWLSKLPGLGAFAFLQISAEFDPYKYNSFATNASKVVHQLTRSVANRIEARAKTNPDQVLPPTLVFKSTVDATVTTAAVVDRLLNHLKPHRHELVLFDINRYDVVKSRLLINDPAPLTDRVMLDNKLPFAVTLVTNDHPKTVKVVARYKSPFSINVQQSQSLNTGWPPGVISLSHVALPIAANDPLYGQREPENQDFLFLGQLAIQGERDLIRVPADWMIRLRYNPFYDFLENGTVRWINKSSDLQK